MEQQQPIYRKTIKLCRRVCTLACDGRCNKAWGVIRPSEQLDPEDCDDVVYLADSELDDAPACNGFWEGGDGKPAGPDQMNRWCARQCERSVIADQGAPIELPDYSQRRYNQPWKHAKKSGC